MGCFSAALEDRFQNFDAYLIEIYTNMLFMSFWNIYPDDDEEPPKLLP